MSQYLLEIYNSWNPEDLCPPCGQPAEMRPHHLVTSIFNLQRSRGVPTRWQEVRTRGGFTGDRLCRRPLQHSMARWCDVETPCAWIRCIYFCSISDLLLVFHRFHEFPSIFTDLHCSCRFNVGCTSVSSVSVRVRPKATVSSLRSHFDATSMSSSCYFEYFEVMPMFTPTPSRFRCHFELTAISFFIQK